MSDDKMRYRFCKTTIKKMLLVLEPCFTAADIVDTREARERSDVTRLNAFNMHLYWGECHEIH